MTIIDLSATLARGITRVLSSILSPHPRLHGSFQNLLLLLMTFISSYQMILGKVNILLMNATGSSTLKSGRMIRRQLLLPNVSNEPECYVLLELILVQSVGQLVVGFLSIRL